MFARDAALDKELVAFLDVPEFRSTVLSTLALRTEEVAKSSPEVIDKIIEFTKTKELRPLALEALNHSTSAAKKALPELIKQLENEKQTYMINKLVSIIGKLGPDAKSAVPVFRKIIAENRGYAAERTEKLLQPMLKDE